MALMDKINNFNEFADNTAIYKSYYNDKIYENIIYLESRNGLDFTGNIFRIAEELSNGKYGDFRIYVYATKDIKEKIECLINHYPLNITKVITDEDEATKVLHKAKYIFTDSGIRHKYIKKPGQIVTNTWHGTPLKLMGFDNPSEQHTIGIIQRSFFFSDYILFPNEYMMDKMSHAYMIDKFYKGTFLLEGYPRNSVFLEDNAIFKEKLNLKGKEVFVYMPTFKGLVNDRKDEQQKNDVDRFLSKLNLKLTDNQILFVKFHPYNQSKIDFSKYEHIMAYPTDFESYDVLNVADVLITDYSSVFFDFASTRRKIIIFNYDQDEYLKDRGLYFPIEDLPFPKVQTVDGLLEELNSPKNYDDSEFIDEYCKYDSIDSAEHICDTVINGKESCKTEIINNSNKNILIYTGSMEDTQALNQLIEMLEHADDNLNIFISFRPWAGNIKENHIELFENIPKNIEFMPIGHNLNPTVNEKIKLNKFVKKGTELDFDLTEMFNRNYKRQYGDYKFDLIIDYVSNDLEHSLTYACSNMNNLIVKNEKTQSKVCNQFNEVCNLSEFDFNNLF